MAFFRKPMETFFLYGWLAVRLIPGKKPKFLGKNWKQEKEKL